MGFRTNKPMGFRTNKPIIQFECCLEQIHRLLSFLKLYINRQIQIRVQNRKKPSSTLKLKPPNKYSVIQHLHKSTDNRYTHKKEKNSVPIKAKITKVNHIFKIQI